MYPLKRQQTIPDLTTEKLYTLIKASFKGSVCEDVPLSDKKPPGSSWHYTFDLQQKGEV